METVAKVKIAAHWLVPAQRIRSPSRTEKNTKNEGGKGADELGWNRAAFGPFHKGIFISFHPLIENGCTSGSHSSAKGEADKNRKITTKRVMDQITQGSSKYRQ